MAKTKKKGGEAPPTKLKKSIYEPELEHLQLGAVSFQEHVKANGLRVVVEGRDAAGKGGVIKHIAEGMSPRVTRVAALPAPNDRERTRWLFQRYVAQLRGRGSSCSTAAGTTAPVSSG